MAESILVIFVALPMIVQRTTSTSLGLLTLASLAILLACSATPEDPSDSQTTPPTEQTKEANNFSLPTHSKWVDSVFAFLSAEERIAQLFVIPAYSNEKHNEDFVASMIDSFQIGGVITMQGGPLRQAHMTNRLQSKAKVPLLVCTDAEWGLKMRLDSIVRFPYAMSLGAIQDDQPIYTMAQQIARHHKRMGIQVNFAPVMDVNNNPNNPVIGFRSFGEDKFNVSRHANAYWKGLQTERVMAVGKHFPGHGDTGSDSHKTLPVIKHDLKRLQEIELFPFRDQIRAGLGGMMIAHLFVPALDSTSNLPTTLSKPVVDGLLKKDMGFRGVIFTDALNMKGVTTHFPSGEIEVRALLAGNDILLFSENVPNGIKAVQKAVKEGRIPQSLIDERCRKMLALKEWAGLDHYAPINTTGLHEALNDARSDSINQMLANGMMTLLRNDGPIIPLKNEADQKQIAVVVVGEHKAFTFQNTLQQSNNIQPFYLDENASDAAIQKVVSQTKGYEQLVVAVFSSNQWASRKFGLTPSVTGAIKALSAHPNDVLCAFTNPYALDLMQGSDQYNAVLLAYQIMDQTEVSAAKVLSGQLKATGQLPVTVNATYRAGMGQ